MVAEEHQIGLYISIPVYFCVLGGCAFWANRRMAKMEHDNVNDKLTAHYLGGRDFGVFLTAGTVFASLFSGYTVIGVPNEAYNSKGWSSLRWLGFIWGVVFGYLGTGIRLRKSSNIRNHQSPVDFITDRYQSQLLRYTTVFLQVVPAVIYLAAQVAAIRSTFNAMFELDAGTVYPVIIIMLVILIFEWLGGLSCVAATDSLQALVMFFSFVAVPSVIASRLGVGWKDLDPSSYPRPEYYQVSMQSVVSFLAWLHRNRGSCIVKTPTKETQWDFWQFSLSGFAFFTLPHLMQRTYAANDLGSLRAGYTAMTLANWFTMPVGCFIGTVGVQLLNGESVPSPFSAVMETLMDAGGFAKVVGVIAATASLAAIMSTADSLVIAISQLVTVEIAYPLWPKASPKKMGWLGRIVSLLAVVVALLIGLIWKDGISALGAIQFPISTQAVPTFLFGLFTRSSKTDIHPWCLSAGALSATVYVFAIYFGHIKSAASPRPINAGITAFALQLALISFLEGMRRLLGISQSSSSKEPREDIDEQSPNTIVLLYPERPAWDVPKLKRFGAHTLSPEKVWKSMEGVHEPMANLSWSILMLTFISLLTPLVAENQPPIDETTGTFSSFAPPATVGGIPWWAAKILIISLLPCLLLLDAIWKTPNHFPVDEKRIEQEGIDPDLVELTLYEKGRRTSYDEQNLLVCSRRSMISTSMKNLGLDKLPSEDLESTASRRRLSALVLAASAQHQLEDLAEEGESEAV
ncbi:hypothetical protein ACHAWF_010859 [Thalassiosira exigua]